jgi:hypothetical protein
MTSHGLNGQKTQELTKTSTAPAVLAPESLCIRNWAPHEVDDPPFTNWKE